MACSVAWWLDWQGYWRVCSHYGCNYSASAGKFMFRGSDRLSNHRFRTSTVVFILDVAQWTSSLPLWGCWRGHESLTSLHVFCGRRLTTVCPGGILRGLLQEYRVPGSLLQAIQSLCNQSESCVHILSTKSNTFLVDVGLPPLLSLVTDPVRDTHG